MELKRAIELAEKPETIRDPAECNEAMAYISGWITDREELEFEQQLEVDKREDELFDTIKVNATVKRKVKLEPIYAEWKQTLRELNKLKRLRSTLKDRFRVLTMSKY